jgi:hypothetical protein
MRNSGKVNVQSLLLHLQHKKMLEKIGTGCKGIFGVAHEITRIPEQVFINANKRRGFRPFPATRVP